MAKRGLKRGRWMIAGGLTVFVLVSAAVIARRSYGHREGLELTALQRRRSNLESERVRLSQDIRDASSRPVIVPIAEHRLGMHIPSELQIVILNRIARKNGAP
ncbi:MAG: cell division protein FtsL [Gemmatimonadaceae bacterium]|nr:cell division protein FtsL [Gemmatimonadaceae bacterium]